MNWRFAVPCIFLGIAAGGWCFWLLVNRCKRWAEGRLAACRGRLRAVLTRREPCDAGWVSLSRKHIYHVPTVITGMAAFVVVAAAWMACRLALDDALGSAHWLVAAPLCGWAAWRLALFPREVQDVLLDLDRSPWMRSRRLVG